MAKLVVQDRGGIQVQFDNGITVSVQIGPGCYGDNYSLPFEDRKKQIPASTTAEIACWDQHREWIDFDGDTVKGYVPVEDVFSFLAFIQSLPSDLTAFDINIACRAFTWREEVAA